MHYSVRGIIKINNGIVLIRRIKKREDGSFREYYVVPGGKMEQHETQEQTVIREIKEELGIIVKPTKKILEYNSDYDDSIQYFYECEYISGKLGTGDGPEMHRKMAEGELFRPEIINTKDISSIHLVPEEIKNLLHGDIS